MFGEEYSVLVISIETNKFSKGREDAEQLSEKKG